jgi:SHS family sialic acid transporter-like MFS transporter
VFTGLCYFARAPWELGALRFIAAFGMGGEWSLGVALEMEAWPSGKRALLAGVIGMASNAGYARAGATVTLIYLVGLALVWLAPETKDQPLPE